MSSTDLSTLSPLDHLSAIAEACGEELTGAAVRLEDLADRGLLMSELRELSVERLAEMVAGFYYCLEDEDE